MTRAWRALAWSLCCVFAACSAPMTPPPEFVVLRDAGDGWRAVTSDDARLRVRDLHDPTAGSVAFWADTLRRDLVEQRGYQPREDGEVTNRDGGAGRWFTFTASVRGEQVGYLVALWVVTPWEPWRSPFIRVAEFAARDDVFRARLASVRAALASMKG